MEYGEWQSATGEDEEFYKSHFIAFMDQQMWKHTWSLACPDAAPRLGVFMYQSCKHVTFFYVSFL